MSCAVPEVGVTVLYDPAAMLPLPPAGTPPKAPPSYEAAVASGNDSDVSGSSVSSIFDDPQTALFCPRPLPMPGDRATLSQLNAHAPFGAQEWKLYFGVDVGAEPSMPDALDAYLRRQDPIDRTKWVWQTHHFLVLVPASFTMDGTQFPYNARTMQLLFSGDKKRPCRGVVEYIAKADCTIEDNKESQWVLMRKNAWCRGKPYAEIAKAIKVLNKTEGINYQIPHLQQAVAVVMAVFARTGMRALNTPLNAAVEIEDKLTYTVVQEVAKEKGFFGAKLPLIIGGFSVTNELWIQSEEKAFVKEHGDCTVGVTPLAALQDDTPSC
jgi:hypothetical protein